MNSSQTVRRLAGYNLRLLALRTRSSRLNAKALSPAQFRSAHQDYGSGTGDPVGENPQAQGPNPSVNKEHPGPPPPNVKEESSSSSNQSQPNQGNPQPKVHAQMTPGSEGDEQIRKHNEEIEQRAAKSHHDESVSDNKDKMDKTFWRGEGDA